MIEAFTYTTIIGFIGQGLFSSRFLVQLFLSEKQQKVVTPSLFWKLSILASIIFFIYGYLRNDFSIILGQILTFFIYIRNLQLQKEWSKLSAVFRFIIIAIPISIIVYFLMNLELTTNTFFKNDNIPYSLLLLGVIAQIVFISRFIYQWLYSETKKESKLPLGFWLISIAGAILILIYAIIRLDIVLIIGNSVGIIIYSRNIILLNREKRTNLET